MIYGEKAGESLKNSLRNYKDYFSGLCESARKRSPGEIYRLYDISIKYDENYNTRLSDFLALLYAMGLGCDKLNILSLKSHSFS
jgi:hypothetical protein